MDSNLVFLEINAIESPSDMLTISEINNNNLLYSIQDNSEGRVVWGQKYLLDGIIFGIENGNSILDLNFNYYLKNENSNFSALIIYICSSISSFIHKPLSFTTAKYSFVFDMLFFKSK